MKLFYSLFLTIALLFSSAAMTAQGPAEKVNINTASVEQIANTMTGIGESRAKAIVEYRTSHGKFKTLDALEHVDGIGAKTVAKNKDKITL